MIAKTLFEHTANFDEKTYSGIWTSKPVRLLRLTIVLIIGIIMLFWSYTLVIGIVVIVLVLIAIIHPRILTKGLRDSYHSNKCIHQPLTYGVSEDRLWVRGKTLDTNATWKLLVTWQIKSDWLILTVSGVPQVFLPISEMKKSGCFKRIMQLAEENGKEFK